MRITVLYNPVSGRGEAHQAAGGIAVQLSRAGHDVELEQTQCEDAAQSLLGRTDPWQNRDLLIVAGGDGAMRGAARRACGAGIAVYHLPLGTENLFAREFGMTKGIDRLIRAIAAWQVMSIDVGEANGSLFLLMASIGLDAEVVHELAAKRCGSISHWTYLLPVARQLVRWRGPELRVEADGKCLAEGRGMVVIANSRQYGWRLDPAKDAQMNDGLLDTVFLPARTGLGVARWAVRCRAGRQMRCPSAVQMRAENVCVDAAVPVRFQLDGDPPPVLGDVGSEVRNGGVRLLRASVKRQSMRVLRPAEG